MTVPLGVAILLGFSGLARGGCGTGMLFAVLGVAMGLAMVLIYERVVHGPGMSSEEKRLETHMRATVELAELMRAKRIMPPPLAVDEEVPSTDIERGFDVPVAPEDALAQAEAAMAAAPRDPAPRELVARLKLRAGLQAEAATLAGEALQIRALHGDMEAAVVTLGTFWDLRSRLVIEAQTATLLAEGFLARGEHWHAAYCFQRAEADGAPAEKIAAGLRRCADRAKEAGDTSAMEAFERAIAARS